MRGQGVPRGAGALRFARPLLLHTSAVGAKWRRRAAQAKCCLNLTKEKERSAEEQGEVAAKQKHVAGDMAAAEGRVKGLGFQRAVQSVQCTALRQKELGISSIMHRGWPRGVAGRGPKKG